MTTMTPGHEPLDPLAYFGPDQPCFGCGPNHPIGFHLHFAREGDSVVTRFTPTANHQGPPGIMHGGLVMTLADELAAWTIIGLRSRFGFTGSATTRFARPVRVGTEVVGRGVIDRDNARLAKVSVTLTQGGAEAFVGQFSFVILDERGASEMLGQTIPDAWKRFCR